MPVFEITSPDGRKFRVNAPEGATREEALAKVREQHESKAAPTIPAVDPTEGMTGLEKFAAGYGKALPDLARGSEQMMRSAASLNPLYEVFLPGNEKRIEELTKEQDLVKERDAPLLHTGAGMTGNILGNAIDTAPMMMVPGMGGYAGAATTGAAFGAMQPTGADDSRLGNAAMGAAAGMAGQAIGNGIGRIIKPVSSALSPEEQALAGAASKEGIPLTAGQQTGSRPMQITESVMENLPLTSGAQLASKEAQQRAFTAAALRRAGMEGEAANAADMLAQKSMLGGKLGEIATRNSIDFNRGLTDKLAQITDDAAAHLPPDASSKVALMVDKVLSQVDDTGRMAGTNYQGWREPLRNLAKSGDASGRYFGQIRMALDDAFKEGIEGADAALFSDASRQYANLKTIINAMGGSGKLPAKGQLSPAQLGAALARSVGKEGKALGRGDLNQLARIGQTFVSEQIPNSGTAQRQLIQALLTSGGGSLVGGTAAGLSGGDIGTGAMAGGAIGAGGLLAPKVVQALMNSPAGQAYLTKGLADLSPMAREALARTLRLGAVSTLPALTQ